MKKLPAIIPLLVVAFLIVSGFAIYHQNKNVASLQRKVLSETDSETHRPEGSPKASEVENPEASETPEPSETPEAEFENEVEREVKDGTEAAKVKIRSGKNKFEFQQEGTKIQIESNFPLSVNPTTRELTVTTPAGTRVVAVLPQEAVDNMLARGVLSTTTGANLQTSADGSLVYHIEGDKSERLLGVVPVTVPKTVIVSAQTGQVVVVNQTVFSRILDILSI